MIEPIHNVDSARSPGEVRSYGVSPEGLLPLLQFIESNLSQDLGLEDLCKVVNLSREHFIRSFKRVMGVTPHRYILERRIEAAKQILTDGTLSMAEIALTLGFCSQSHFSDTFRRLTGMTPRRFLQFRCAQRYASFRSSANNGSLSSGWSSA